MQSKSLLKCVTRRSPLVWLTQSKAAKDEVVRPSEAQRAYDSALEKLESAALVPPPRVHNAEATTSLLAAYRGPIGSAVRIAAQIFYQPWIPKAISFLTERGVSRRYEEAKSRGAKAVDLLSWSASQGYTEAMFKLAQISLFPPPILQRDPSRAFEMYFEHALLTGNATSQAMVAFFYATGYGGATEKDQANALLYYTFAANGDNTGAQMALAFRHWSGIGVKEDCMTSLGWYEAVAEKAMATFLAGPPGGRTMPLLPTRLADYDGGAYGAGASVSSTGLNINRNVNRAYRARVAGEKWHDVVAYYTFHADRGDIDFALRLGRIFYQGSLYTIGGGLSGGAEAVGAVPRDYLKARSYYMKVARLVWPRDIVTTPLVGKRDNAADNHKAAAAIASAYLGRMSLRGEGVRQDPKMAKMWFERGVEGNTNAECANGLGIIWRDGLVDGQVDTKKAIANFAIAANQDHAEAQVNLGKHYYARGDLVHALMYFESAIKHGSPFEAYYYIAQINAANAYASKGANSGACSFAVSFYKHISERGNWKENLIGDAESLWFREGNRDKEGAMLRWLLAAERGYESAQNNIAYTLDEDRNSLRGTPLATPVSNDTARLALSYWIRSSAQRNIDALVKVGDYYFHGLGVSSDEPETLRWEKAAGYYHAAVETHVSALAMWNLGWMYENGRGVTRDYHLAKRYYDMASQTNSEAYFPVFLSLMRLYARSFWYTLTGGREKALTLNLWDNDSVDGWYIGRAKDELVRRLRGERMGKAPAAGEGQEGAETDAAEAASDDREDTFEQEPEPDEDPIQWARDRRNAEAAAAAQDDYGPDDYWDGNPRPRRRNADGEEEEDDLSDTVILLVLCAVVTALLWVRGRWVERRRQEEQQQNPNAPPPPPPFQAPGIVL